MTTTNEINAAAAGKDSTIRIYWDSQDPGNVGPAWTDGVVSGGCDFVGWSNGPQGCRWPDKEKYMEALAEYFDGDGRYTGPDSDGIYPTFEAC